MSSRGSPEEKRLRAQAYFEKGEQRRVEAAKSHSDYRAAINADAAKTIRLRALRLAKEAADELAAKERAAKKKALARAKPVRKTKPTAES
jgi:transcriptional regulator of nitric oxide reductase